MIHDPIQSRKVYMQLEMFVINMYNLMSKCQQEEITQYVSK